MVRVFVKCIAGVIVSLSLWVYSMGVGLREQAGACDNVLACSATRRFVLLIKRTYNVDCNCTCAN